MEIVLQPKVNILIVDDHEIVRAGLISSLTNDRFRVVAAVGCGNEALAFAKSEVIDLAILDLRLPDMSGRELASHLRSQQPEIKIIILSTYLSENLVRASLKAGADAFVAKAAGIDELRQTLDRVLEGSSQKESPEDTVQRQRSGDIMLTPQQERVLMLAAQGLIDRAIASRLHLSEATVRFHMQRLREILGARSKGHLIAEAIRRELITVDVLEETQ
jgi:two-component system NarL family response regulator